MKKLSGLTLLFFVSTPTLADKNTWFTDNNSVNQVHSHLLAGELSPMFQAWVEQWQIDENPNHRTHLLNLYKQSLEQDCGKTIANTTLPTWLQSVTFQETEIRNPNSQKFVTSLLVDTDIALQEARLFSPELSNDLELIELENSLTSQSNTLTLRGQVAPGLYQLKLKTQDKQTWNHWVVLGVDDHQQVLQWQANNTWQVTQAKLPNRACPQANMDLTLTDFSGSQPKTVWSESHRGKFPSAIVSKTISPARYVLTISLSNTRWHGPIAIEKQLVTSKTHTIELK